MDITKAKEALKKYITPEGELEAIVCWMRHSKEAK